jgi:hypothetical protein
MYFHKLIDTLVGRGLSNDVNTPASVSKFHATDVDDLDTVIALVLPGTMRLAVIRYDPEIS